MNETKPQARSWPGLWPSQLADEFSFAAPTSRGRVRLRTLSNLRWLAMGGQSATLFVVYFGLGYDLPLWRCAGVIAASAVLNILLAMRFPASHRLTNREATVYLAYDVLQLAALLYLTGGLDQPLRPDVPGAGRDRGLHAQSRQHADPGRASPSASVSLIAVFHEPLPWARRMKCCACRRSIRAASGPRS